MKAFLNKLQVSQGLVQAFTLSTIEVDDLPQLSPNPAGTWTSVTVDQHGLVVSGSAGGGGVTSFNARTGAVTLTGTDVTDALGFADIARTGVDNNFSVAQTFSAAVSVLTGNNLLVGDTTTIVDGAIVFANGSAMTNDGLLTLTAGPGQPAIAFDSTNGLQLLDASLATVFKLGMDGQVWTNQTAAAGTLGTVVAKMPLYDAAGSLVGYLPVYDDIT